MYMEASEVVSRARASAWLDRERIEKIPEIVAREIVQDIISRNLAPGDPLATEAMMMKHLGVGRTSLREGLRILEFVGIIRIKAGPKGGPMVADLGRNAYGRLTNLLLFRLGSTYGDLLEARLIIEPMMARLAAERLTPGSAKLLEQVVAEGHEPSNTKAETWAKHLEFHSVITGMTRNSVLDLFGGALIGIERGQMNIVFPREEDREATIKIHDRIAAAILSRDAVEAERLTRRHVVELARRTREEFGSLLNEPITW